MPDSKQPQAPAPATNQPDMRAPVPPGDPAMAPFKDPFTDGSGGWPIPAMTAGMTFRDIGSTGLRQFGGWVREEFLPQLIGRQAARTYREMLDNSSVVGSITYAITSAMRKVEWRTQPANDSPEASELADFAEECRLDMSHTWEDKIVEALSMLGYGFAPHEIVYKRRLGMRPGPDPDRPGKNLPQSRYDDGRIGWKRQPLRGQDTIIKWFFSENGQVKGLTQQPWIGPLIDLPIEKLLLYRPSSHKNNPEGKSILRTAYRCFSDDTEMLTGNGWKLALAVTKDDELATLNQTTEEIEYHRPRHVYAFPYRGKMFEQTGRFIDLCVTPNHRMWVRRDAAEQFEFIEASDLKRHVYYKRDAIWTGEEVAEFILPAWQVEQRLRQAVGAATVRTRTNVTPAKHIVMDDWLRFFGIWIAEGWTHQNKNGQRFVGISQNEGPNLDLICAWVERCGFPYRVKKERQSLRRQIEICSAQLFDYLRPFGKSHDKHLPRYLLELSKRQLQILFEAMWLGDGSTSGNANGHPGTRLYNTVSRRLADDTSELLFKLGYAPIVRWQKPTGFGNGLWVVSCARARKGGNRVNLLKDQRRWIDYDAKVHCVEVENGLVYVRRNGKSCWSGNSYYFTKRLEEQEAILFERLSGLPVVTCPNVVLQQAAAGDPVATAVVAQLKKIATNVRIDEQMGILLPSDRWPGQNGPSSEPMYKFELITPTAGRNNVDSDKALSRYHVNILTSVLADFLQLGHEARGTQSLAVSKVDMFFQAIEGYLNSIAAVDNRYGIPRLWQLNGLDLELMPEFVPDLAQRVDLDVLSNFILRLSQSGMPLFPDLDLENYLRDTGGLPDVADEAAHQALISAEQDAAQPGGGEGDATETDPATGEPISAQKRLLLGIVKGSIVRRLRKLEGHTSIVTKRRRPRGIVRRIAA
jgi:hypothetical protein